MAGAGKLVCRDRTFARKPSQGRRGREQIGAVGRAGVLAAVGAVAQIEAIERTVDAIVDIAAQT